MKSPPLVIFPPAVAGAPWRVGSIVDGQPHVEVLGDTTTAAAAAAVRERGARQITLALPSAWCLSATVATDDVTRRNRRSALTYRLELSLPVAAEDVAVDFVEHPQHATALGVAVLSSELGPLVAALTEVGVAVVAASPLAVLALQQLAATQPAAAVVWGDDDAVEILVRTDGVLERWFTVPADADAADVRRHVGAAAAWLCNVDRSLASQLEVVGGDNVAIRDAAVAAVAAKRVSWVDVARGDLNVKGQALRRPLIRVAIAAGLAVACACGAALWRASQYDRLATGEERRQARVFHDLFPGRATPVDVRSRLASEERGLRGVAGPADAPATPPAAALLHDLLAHLPTEARYQVHDLRVADGRVSIEGTARSRADADAVAAGVREVPRLQIDPTQTEQGPGRTFRFTVTGSAPAPAERSGS